jgi:hypothetical protein
MSSQNVSYYYLPQTLCKIHYDYHPRYSNHPFTYILKHLRASSEEAEAEPMQAASQ